ncbi:MAG: seg [archaeon GW2011_AR5]|nr:MAG: seg [archaeon GW2011_AR5]MBS3051621.1 hypothetical protein [Candidatus Aenigmarchaeota archaeon]
MFGTVQKLLSKEDAAAIKKRRIKVRKEMYVCNGCGHLYYYRIIKCPLCESLDTAILSGTIGGGRS